MVSAGMELSSGAEELFGALLTFSRSNHVWGGWMIRTHSVLGSIVVICVWWPFQLGSMTDIMIFV